MNPVMLDIWLNQVSLEYVNFESPTRCSFLQDKPKLVVGDPNQQISMEALSLVEGQEEPGHQERPVLPAGQLVHLLLF